MKEKDKELINAATVLGMDYRGYKSAEKAKNGSRDEFFRLATEYSMQRMIEQVIIAYAKDEESLHLEIARKYPGWFITEYKQVENHFEVRLQENPELSKFTFVNPRDGMVYTRQVMTGVMMLDDDRIREENPEFWEEISFVPQERQLRPIEELTPEQVKALQQYTYMTRPTPKLGAPRKATEEELAEAIGESIEESTEKTKEKTGRV